MGSNRDLVDATNEASATIAARLQAPIRDRRGRISPLKAVTFVLVLAPGAWLITLAAIGELTPLPYVFLIYNSGIWALWMLVASLAVTPARHILAWGELIVVRRMVGLAGFAYTLVHVVVYVGLDSYDIGFIANEFMTRPTIWVATASTLGLVALGVTSFDDAIRRMGSQAWNRLHNLTYPAIGLAVLHFDLGPGSVGGPPFLITGMFFWLMAWRILHRFGKGSDPVALAGLAVANATASFAFEIAWDALYQGISPAKQIGFTFDVAGGLAPTWQLLVVGLIIATLARLFGAGAHFRRRHGVEPPRRSFAAA